MEKQMDNAKSCGCVPAHGEIPVPEKVNKYQEFRTMMFRSTAARN
jgi:hypothetical protein